MIGEIAQLAATSRNKKLDEGSLAMAEGEQELLNSLIEVHGEDVARVATKDDLKALSTARATSSKRSQDYR